MTPRALAPFLALPQAMRKAGFAVSPDQTISFLEGVGVLGPRSITDVWRTGRALFSVPPERLVEYDAIFRLVFLGQSVALPAEDGDDSVEAHEPTGDSHEIELADDEDTPGDDAVTAELQSHRRLHDSDDAALLRLSRAGPAALPRRRSFRHARAHRGSRMDMRRILRDAARREGDVLELFQTRRKTRQRRVLLLIDVSGSMRERTEASLRLAHGVVQVADRAEVFTLGTRLTRITAALRPAGRAGALERAGAMVADFDGGTRIGEAMSAFLAVPRFAGFARGAAVIVLSDGLERGDPGAMVDAVARLSRSAWRLDWLTPLARDPDYRPETAGLKAVLPYLDTLADGADSAAITDHILNLRRAR